MAIGQFGNAIVIVVTAAPYPSHPRNNEAGAVGAGTLQAIAKRAGAETGKTTVIEADAVAAERQQARAVKGLGSVQQLLVGIQLAIIIGIGKSISG